MPSNPDITILPYKGKSPIVHPTVYLAQGVRLIGDLEIGQQSSIWFNAVIRGDVNYIRIGERTNVQDNSVIHVTHLGKPTIIGNDVTIGHQCMIHACMIKDLCLIGMGSIVMDGVEIREGSIVGAGSIVTQNKTFPPNSLIMGAPAKFIRHLNEEESKKLAHSAVHYVNVASFYLDLPQID
jgi:carbonic anhydrase/acetyltransferase-like protein (isoleucine patch superfamily)